MDGVMNTELMKEALSLLEKNQYVVVTSIDADGFPRTRALQKVRCEGLRYIWFTTSNQSAKAVQFRNNPRASIYVVDNEQLRGLMLVGTMEVLEDRESKELAWQDGFEKYYPDGIETPWYCVLRFTAFHGQYYHGKPHDFRIPPADDDLLSSRGTI